MLKLRWNRAAARRLLAAFAAPATIVVLAAIAPAPARAATYVPMTDAALADQAPLIVEVEVVARTPGADRPVTDYAMAVRRAIKGRAGGSALTVRVPGRDPGPDGVGLKIWGAPAFRVGERALLFLAPRDDGSYGVSQLLLGAFHVVARGGVELVVRDLSEGREVRPGGLHGLPLAGPPAAESARDLHRFAAWLGDRDRGLHRPADYRVALPAEEMQAIVDGFTLFVDGSGLNYRWFEFDGGGTVSWRAHQSGQAGVPGGSFTEVPAALAAWNADPDSRIAFVYAGTTTASGGLVSSDGVNTVLFDDPNGEIGGSFSCGAGGTLAYGGFYTAPGTGVFKGTTFRRIGEGDVVTQDGAGCYFAQHGGKDGEEVFAHEFGHALGIAHSSVAAALMYPFAHGDGRGAQLGADDRAAAFYLYGDDAIFSDGFESGDLSAWSASVP